MVESHPSGSCPVGSFPNGESSWWGRQSGWSKCCLMGSRPGRESSGWELFSGELS